MKFVCDNCSTQYLISDDKVTPRGVKVRCKRCGNIIMVQASQPSGEPTDRTLTKQAPPGGTEPDAGPPLGAADTPAAEERDELGQAFDQLLKDGLPPDDSGEEGEDEGQETAVLSMEEIERQRFRKKGIERDKIDRVFDNLGSSQVSSEPSSPGGAEEWYVAIRDQQVGPLALAEVERRFAAGELNSESLAWQSGMGDWQPIRDIPRLRYLIGRGGARAEEKKDVPTAVSKPSEAPAQQWAPVQESSLSSLVEDELAQVKSKPPPAAPAPAAAPVAGESEDGELAPWEKEEVVSGEVARPPESFFDSSLDRKVPGTGGRYFEDTRHSQVIAGPAYLGGARGKSSSKVLALSVIAGLVIVVGGGAAFLLLSNHNADPNPGPVPMPPPQAEAGPVAAGGPDAGTPVPVVDAGVAEAVDAGQGTGPEGVDGGREVVVVAPGQNDKQTDGAGKNPKPGEGKKPRPGGTTVTVKTPKTPDRPGGEPKDPKPPKPPDKTAGGDEGLGPMTKETVMGTLRAYQRAMKGCVEQQLQRDPTVTGTLVVGFVIQNSGKVNEVNVLSEEHRGTFVAICISQVIKGIGFPKFSGPPFEVPRMPLRLGG